MPRRTAACRHVSHRGIYSQDTLEMSTYAMGSKTQQGQERAALTVWSTVLIRLR